MKRELAGGYELDDDRARIDVAATTAFLAGSYWAFGRTVEEQRRLDATSARLVGLYHGGAQVGYARVSYWPQRRIAFLNDVYVLEEHRGRGLGLELTREAVELGPHADALWLLRTEDMHRLYAKLGFHEPGATWMIRP
jgi:GNAT superfamily N-acetyltransferase